jgi:hypothetical protein
VYHSRTEQPNNRIRQQQLRVAAAVVVLLQCTHTINSPLSAHIAVVVLLQCTHTINSPLSAHMTATQPHNSIQAATTSCCSCCCGDVNSVRDSNTAASRQACITAELNSQTTASGSNSFVLQLLLWCCYSAHTLLTHP